MEFGARQWADHCEKQAARIAQLEAALRGLSGGECYTSRSAGFRCGSFTQGRLCALCTARAALAATPADAGRRWEAMRDCTTALRALLEAPRDVQWVLAQRRAISALDALARLDAEGE